MANYEDLKKKAKDALDTIVDVSAEAYRIAEEKTRILAKKAKLNADITRERALIKRLKGNIGDKYYELHNDSPEEAFKEDCESITDSLARINAKKRELDDLKNSGDTSESCDEDCDEDCCADESGEGESNSGNTEE